MNAAAIGEFYHQLALLIKSGLPLPDSLQQMGRQFPSPRFRNVVEDLGRRSGQGELLAQALRRYPQYFTPFHIRLLEIGEASDTLPHMLFTVARLARFGQVMTTHLKEIVAYPLVTIHLAALVFVGISLIVLPAFRNIFEDMLGGAGLPALTELVLDVGGFIQTYRVPVLGFYVLLVAFTAWLLLPGVASHRALLGVIGSMPGSWRIVHSLDGARVCSLLSIFLRRSVPLPEALQHVANLVETAGLRRGLTHASGRMAKGISPAEAIADESAVDRLIALTFAHTAETELADELDRLAEVFEHRVTLSARSASLVWTVVAMVAMALVVGTVAISLFLPLVNIVGALSG